MHLADWARTQGIHPQTAYRWYKNGTLPIPVIKTGNSILVQLDQAPQPGLGLYARVSGHDQKADLDRQVARLSKWAANTGYPIVRVESEIGSGMNGHRAKARRLLADPKVTTVVVEHRDRLGRMNIELVQAALEASGRRLIVLDEGELDHDLVSDMIEILTSFCGRLYGKRTARTRARKAVGCAQHDMGPVAAGLWSK